MTVAISFTYARLDGKPTIATTLAAKLGREPTHRELCEEVQRILSESPA
jgi:hypothetical protein